MTSNNREECAHDIIWGGLCAVCGKTISETDTKKTIPYSNFYVSEREAQIQQKDTETRLINAKKLALVLDIDHTLLHATTQQFLRSAPIDSDVVEFSLPPLPMKYYLKLR